MKETSVVGPRDRFSDYLDAYARKDLARIADQFADGIRLRDWKISVSGKERALDETRRNFEAATSIRIDVLDIHESQGSVAGELRIVVDGTDVLYVVDVLSFDAAGRISSIRAYLGRGD